jgi:hypothetical protein
LKPERKEYDMFRRAILPALIVGVASFGCESGEKTVPAAPVQQTQAVAQAAGSDHDHDHGQESGDKGHDCGGGHTTQLQHDRAEQRTAEDGTSYTHVGAELEGAAEATIADIVSNPEAWNGKVIALTGHVSTMCTHRRGWFGMVNEGDQSGAQVQVRTAPSFLVPAGAVGRGVRVEGRVEIVEIAEAHARYLAESHKVGEPEDIQGPQKRAVIIATGADFI